MSVTADDVDRPVDRFTISQCIGCGSMQVDETCEVCDYERLELVDSADYDALASVLDAKRAEMARAREIIGELADGRISSAQAGAKLTEPNGAAGADLPDGAVSVAIWRCRRCGAIDAMQECLGICIWRTFEWVRAEEVRRLRSELDDLDVQLQAHMKLRTQLVHSRPRAGHEIEHRQALKDAARALAADPDDDALRQV